MKTIDITPSTTGYIQMLEMAIANSTNINDVQWAEMELGKIREAINNTQKRKSE